MNWQPLLEQYERDHQHPVNRRLHLLGVTLIGSSVLTALVPPLSLTLFVSGWAAQLIGHRIEGKPPSFTREPTYMAVGAVWYAREVRALVERALTATKGRVPG